ncbi:MAG: DEAD/DEAH box helicase family protein [Selenomonadaceae bacterium]|nr:DEAD/DEAH box helicase family protein [Selenomonadaceae bacterium]
MKLQFKHQKFQSDAAKAVVDVFAGQPKITETFSSNFGLFGGNVNAPIILSSAQILDNLQMVQRRNNIKQSTKLEKIGKSYNLTIEMETGVGKTYTYIKTMYELNQAYGWNKFIIVVPSIAIREGVHKTFKVTAEHFAEEYGEKIRFFIYNSARLNEIKDFVSDNAINAMIINAQAFNARGENARRILTNLDEFGSDKPIEMIAETNPILIIDEPQSVEGAKTKEGLKEFNPLMTLRYSATHRADSVYNMIYRLDAVDAYNKKLVKKIFVTGITLSSIAATLGFVRFEKINLSDKSPTATITFDYKGASAIRQVTRTVSQGFNLYENSGELDEYKNNFVVNFIDGRDNSIEFLNGVKMFEGDVIGSVDEDKLRRLQIRETIKAHFERERQLFSKGIKVLSLFFIDEVKHYRIYDAAGNAYGGDFAKIFEEEYLQALKKILDSDISEDYRKYLAAIPVERTHAGYFSVDKKGRLTDSAIKDKKAQTSDDTDAYDLIMRNKELLLDTDAAKSPVRFIFSHSALREGWDNPNVFQICTLKHSGSDIRKRQEVGRGLRLCVNQSGERMDENFLGEDVHAVNILTVIASESYEDFTKKLQTEIADAVAYRPRAVTVELLKEKFDSETAESIVYDLIGKKYIDKKGALTEKYYDDKESNSLTFDEEIAPYADSIIALLDTIFDERKYPVDDASKNNVNVKLRREKLDMPEFKALWSKIRARTIPLVNFETDELIKNAVDALNKNLNVKEIFFQIKRGEMEDNITKENLEARTAFSEKSGVETEKISIDSAMKYDVIGRLVEGTGFTRRTVIKILCGVDENIFAQVKNNPEEFIMNAAQIINGVKVKRIVEHITYQPTGDDYGTNIFTDAHLKGDLDTNALPTTKHLFSHVIYDSQVEKKFAQALEDNDNVIVYVKFPRSFYIMTPLGRYNPDWAFVTREGGVNQIYFVAETKGTVDELQLRPTELFKINCAKKHFKTIADGAIKYCIGKNYNDLK